MAYLDPLGIGNLCAWGGKKGTLGLKGLSDNSDSNLPPLPRTPSITPPPMKIIQIPNGDLGTAETVRWMTKLITGDQGAMNPMVVALARKIAAGIASKDHKAELRAIYDYAKKNIAYRLDPRGLEYIQAPAYTLFVEPQEDCFTKGTLVLLRAGHKLVPIESLREGDEIWGQERWSKVEKTWDKGILPTCLIELNNGASVRLTADHKVWVKRCARHPVKALGGTAARYGCLCDKSAWETSRVKVSELVPDDVLLQPEKVGFGTEDMDVGRAYIEGLYLSDGWSVVGEKRFSISGQDGCPRETQKLEVQEICARLGIHTRWNRKYIAVNDEAWTLRLQGTGGVARNKSALSLNLSEVPARQFLRGILADSGRHTGGPGRMYSTSSREMFYQVRTLLRMFGISASTTYLSAEEHGGLGTHGIWRMNIRGCKALEDIGTIYDKHNRAEPVRRVSDGQKHEKFLRVKAVTMDGLALPCFDIRTDDHKVWLPEADWTTSQCDGYTMVIAALTIALGMGAKIRTIKADPGRPDEFSHVYPVVGYADADGEHWYPADATQLNQDFGWEPPANRVFASKDWPVAAA